MLCNTTLLLFFLSNYGMLRLLEAIFKLNTEERIYIYIYILQCRQMDGISFAITL
jgi:hypothetical protein